MLSENPTLLLQRRRNEKQHTGDAQLGKNAANKKKKKSAADVNLSYEFWEAADSKRLRSDDNTSSCRRR